MASSSGPARSGGRRGRREPCREEERTTTSEFALYPNMSSHQWHEPRQMASPSPVPSCLRVADMSACVKASKTGRADPDGMPMPESAHFEVQHHAVASSATRR